MNLKPEVAIISAFNNSVLTPEENEIRHKDLKAELEFRGMSFKEVLGCYRGNVEKSFVVNVNEDKHLTMVKALASLFSQESVLVIDQERKAKLWTCETNSETKLGDFRPVSALQAKDLENWTLDGTQYYTVV